MEFQLVHSPDQVFIKNIPPFDWGKHRDNTFIRATQFALQTLGYNYTYDYLMGISGTAFRIHFHPDYCPSSVDATVGFDVSRVLFKILGVDGKAEFVDTNSFLDIRNYFLKVKKQIDNGIPIIAINLKVSPDWGLITGYYTNKPGILCRTYYDESKEYSDAERAPWVSFFISIQNGDAINPKDVFLDAMQRIVTLAKTKKYEEYFNGSAAYQYWIEKLNLAKKSMRGKAFYEKMNGNNIIFHFLSDARIAAYNYLNTNKFINVLPRADQIINVYKDVAEIMQQTCVNVLPPLGQDKENWSLSQLEQQVEALQEISALEKQAVKWIETDLSSMK